MAVASKNYGQVKLTSSYNGIVSTGVYATTIATTANSPTFSATFADLGIPAGATINSAVFTYTETTYPLHGFATKALRSGSSIIDNWFNNNTSVTLSSVASFYIRFVSEKNNTTYGPPSQPYKNSSTWTIDNLTLTVDYTPPQTACTAPTSISVSPTSGGPGFSSTLSWSGASGGTNNPIKHYQVQRSVDGGAWQNLTTTTSTSVTVNGSASNNGKHAYRIISIATQSGYDSGASSSATQTTTFSAPTAPTTVSVSSAYVASGNVTLSWSGATAGTNNPINSYSIYRDGSAYTTSTGTSVSVPSNTAGNYYTYTVYAVGAHSNSGVSSGATVYTYSNPTAPTNVQVAQTVIDAGTSTTLSWTAGSNGHYNAISEYHVYRRTNGSGNYTYLNKTTGTSLSVTAHGTMTSYYDYVVYSIGSRSNSGASGSARLTTKNYTKVNAPTTVSVSSTYVTSGNVTLSWSGASGGTNTTVASYQVYRNGTAYGNPTTGSSMAVPSASAGSSYTYTVVAISSPAGYNSSASSGAIVRTYGAPSAPTTVTVNGVAGTTYFGNQGRPTITLAWSGASAGTYGSISKYIVYRDNANPIETTSTSMVVTADGTYTVRTVASGGTSGNSVGRAVTTIGAPTFNQFTGQPSGKSNGNVSYSWSANAAPANSSLVYHVAYRNGGTGSTWIAGTGTTASYPFNVNSYITQGNYYQLGVLVRANATHGGYRDATAGYVFSSANTAYRAAAPAKPTNLVFTDQGGNTSYSTNQVNLTFSYSIPTRGANVSRYEIFYKYGKTGGYTKLVNNYNGSVTHNIASVAAGLQIYYKVEVVDEYGYRNSVESGDTYITKLVMPTISSASFTPTDVPNTAGNLVFTPGNGGVSRPLKYSARILYDDQSYSLTGFTQVPSPGSALTFTKTGMGISALNSAGMTSLFSYVITNANVAPVITVEITVADNQTIPVVGNQTVHTFTYTANYRTTPTLNGTLTLSNATATANSKTIDYMNSEDELAVSTSGMSVSWLNAAGTTVGQNLTYRLTYQGITENLSGFPSGNLVKTMLGVFTGDTTVTASLVIIQSFNGEVTTSSVTKNASISAKRFIKPSITFANSERTAGAVFKTRIGISDSLCGGSSTANNITTITNVKITAGTSVNTIQNSAVAVASNKWKINDTVVPVNISSLNASAITDVSVSASATLTLSSGRTVTINSTPFLLKALGVALAIRKTRVGINVEPTSFVESANSPSFVLVENQLNTDTPYILDIQSATGNNTGVGIRLFDTEGSSSTILTYKNNHLRINKRVHAMATSSSATVAGSPDYAGLIVHNTSSTYGLATGVLSNGQAWLQAQRFDGGATLYALNLNPLGGQVNINGQLALNATNYTSYVTPAGIGAAAASHGNHVPTTQTANNAIYLRNDNTWQTITPAEIGAAASSHSHSYLPLSGGTITGTVTFTNSFQYHAAAGGWARGLSYKTNDGSTDVGFVGAYGSSDTMTHFIMGTTYNDPKGFRWYPDGTATLNGSQVLHASNYNSYAPSKTGGGASGSWGISITGSSASLTTARTLTIGSTGKTFNGTGNVSWSLAEIGAAAESHSHNYVPRASAVDVTTGATSGSNALWLGSNTAGSTAFPTEYGYTAYFAYSGARGFALYRPNGQSQLYAGFNSSSNILTDWRVLLDSGNYNSYALPLSGGVLSGQLHVNDYVYVKLAGHDHRTVIQTSTAGTNDALFGVASSGWAITDYLRVGQNLLKYTTNNNSSSYDVLHSGNYTTYAQKKITAGTAAPTGGSNGDVYIMY